VRERSKVGNVVCVIECAKAKPIIDYIQIEIPFQSQSTSFVWLKECKNSLEECNLTSIEFTGKDSRRLYMVQASRILHFSITLRDSLYPDHFIISQ
jgi:hypothetical protein